MRKVLAFLKEDYFSDNTSKLIYKTIESHVEQYNSAPTVSNMEVILEKEELSENEFKALGNDLAEIENSPKENSVAWLTETTEKFCKERSVFNAIHDCIKIIDGKDKKETRSQNAIPELLRDALGVSFDTNIGHNYLEGLEHRYNFYHNKIDRIPFDLHMMNMITDGGIPKKTLNVIAGSTGSGKSIWLCHHAANCIRQGKNVLYITLEMSEERIAERIDANLMDIALHDLRSLPKSIYEKKFNRVKQNVSGTLIIKEYPTSSASSMTFRHLLDELKMKSNLEFDVLIVDYLNICASSRYKAGANVNSYTFVKAIAEELRGLAVERNLQLMTGTQINRQGTSSSDVDITATAESMGLPMTADFFFALIRTEELDALNQVMFKQLKNRYADAAMNRKFIMGLDKSKMKFYDVSNGAQKSLTHSMVQAPINTTRSPSLLETEAANTEPFEEDSEFSGFSEAQIKELGEKNKFAEWT